MITVLRLGHRPDRDKRITTHVALTARAFGADSVVVSTKDDNLEQNVRSVVKRFGGPFEISTGVAWRRVLNDFKGQIVHLTMYGEQLDEAVPKLDPDKDVLIVVGSTKVPRMVYDRADLNVSVGNQPHSEVAALAMLLDRITSGRGLKKEFTDYELRVVPDPDGKTVIPPDWIPDREECFDLLGEAGIADNVLAHIRAVTGLAEAMGKRLVELGIEIDQQALLAGSLLHDIGRANTHKIDHAVEGVSLLEGYGISHKVIGIVTNHIGAGITKEEAEGLGLPPQDYTPSSIEEKVLASADNLFEGDKRVPLARELKHLEDLGLADVAKKVEKLHKEMSELLQIELDELSSC